MDKLTKQVVDWCNSHTDYVWIKQYGGLDDMPVGVIMDENSCPIARAIGTEVHPETITLHNGNELLLPDFVQKWIKKFDEGDYPQYIAADDHEYSFVVGVSE